MQGPALAYQPSSASAPRQMHSLTAAQLDYIRLRDEYIRKQLTMINWLHYNKLKEIGNIDLIREHLEHKLPALPDFPEFDMYQKYLKYKAKYVSLNNKLNKKRL